jgi:predicted RNase H-like HicB family nuclease
MNYHFKIYKEKKGYWAEGIEIPSCFSQGDTLSELKENLQEALSLLLDEPEDSKVIFPLPNRKIKTDNVTIEIEVEPNIAFAFLLRRTRLTKGLTQQQMKEKLDFKSLFSYQKLEMSKYANPTLKSLKKIKDAMPDFPFQLLL